MNRSAIAVDPYMSLVAIDFDHDKHRKGKLARALEKASASASASAQVIETEEAKAAIAAAAAYALQPEKRRKTKHLHPIFFEVHEALSRHMTDGFDDVFTIITDSLGSGQLPALRLAAGLDYLGHHWMAQYMWDVLPAADIRGIGTRRNVPKAWVDNGSLDLTAALAMLAFECITQGKMRFYISAARLAADQPFVVRFESVRQTEVFTTAVCPGCFTYDQTVPFENPHIVHEKIPRLQHHVDCPQVKLGALASLEERPWLLNGGAYFVLPSVSSIRLMMHMLFDDTFYGQAQVLEDDGDVFVYGFDRNNAAIDNCLIQVSVTDLID